MSGTTTPTPIPAAAFNITLGSTVEIDNPQGTSILTPIKKAFTTATSVPAGTDPSVGLVFADNTLTFNFSIPSGADGVTPIITMGTVTTYGSSQSATATLTPVAEQANTWALNLGIPRGPAGAAASALPNIVIGTVTVGSKTSDASVTAVQSQDAKTVTFNFVLPPADNQATNLTKLALPSCSMSELPASPAQAFIYLVTDGCKPGETSGSGTGVVCVWDGRLWMDLTSGKAVTT